MTSFWGGVTWQQWYMLYLFVFVESVYILMNETNQGTPDKPLPSKFNYYHYSDFMKEYQFIPK